VLFFAFVSIPFVQTSIVQEKMQMVFDRIHGFIIGQ